MLEKGLVQIYTGDGKGKTTAAFGLALRVAGHGGKVLIYQFLKPQTLDLGERASMEKIPGVTVQSLNEPWDMHISLDNDQAVSKIRSAIKESLSVLTKDAAENRYDVMIFDEMVFCVSKGLAELEDVGNMIDKKDPKVEIVMTGRGADSQLIAMADLVTEMKAVKHPFEKKIGARKGIEY